MRKVLFLVLCTILAISFSVPYSAIAGNVRSGYSKAHNVKKKKAKRKKRRHKRRKYRQRVIVKYGYVLREEYVAKFGKQYVLSSWYGPGFHGRFAANGRRFNQWKNTAAHRTLPFGTIVELTNLAKGRKVKVRITDRGPVKCLYPRELDVSRGVARKLGFERDGVIILKMVIIKIPERDDTWIVRYEKAVIIK